MCVGASADIATFLNTVFPVIVDHAAIVDCLNNGPEPGLYEKIVDHAELEDRSTTVIFHQEGGWGRGP